MDWESHSAEADAERLLLSFRPDLDADARDRIEVAVLGRPVGRRGRRRAVGFAAALVGGLVVLILALTLAGAVTLNPSQDTVYAGPDCHYVESTATVPTAVVVRRPDGSAQVETRPRAVTRFVRHCR